MGCWNCGCESMWFDRTMEPPCDSMHNVCEACSETQSCGDDKCLYGVKTDKKLHCSSAGQRGGEVVEKCPKCNDPKCYAHTLWADDVDEVECLTRQLAAANERAGRYRNALEWYADPCGWEPRRGPDGELCGCPAWDDRGHAARKALDDQAR